MDREYNPFTVQINATYMRPFSKSGNQYVALRSGSEYSITLHNGHDMRCDAELYIDNEHVGGYVINAHSSINIERPHEHHRKFTFFSEHSDVARDVGASIGAEHNGLIHVVFKPKKREPKYIPLGDDYSRLSRSPPRMRVSGERSPPRIRAIKASKEMSPPRSTSLESARLKKLPSRDTYTSGVTVLGDRSYQEFYSVRSLLDNEIDHSLIRNIYIRLVVEHDHGRRYIPLNNHRYPPRLDGSSHMLD